MTTPTLVLLHGVGLDHSVWDPVRARMSGDAHVVAPDLPGHGARPPVGPVTLAELAADVAHDVPPGAHLVGFSLGALVAQYLAVHRPDLVASLVSVSSVCRRTPDERAAVLARLAGAERDFPASVTASLHRWFDGADVAPDVVEHTRSVLLANDPESFTHCYRVFATADAEIGDRLGDIRVPALAITGRDDPGSTPEMSARLAAAIPDCDVTVVADARHMLPVQRPDALARALSTFYGRFAHV